MSFMLTALKLDILRSSPQKSVEIFKRFVKFWLSYSYLNSKLNIYEWQVFFCTAHFKLAKMILLH